MNGRGKTTFLEAVLLALYGSNSFAYTESGRKSYSQYLRSFINRNADDNICKVELEFDFRPLSVYANELEPVSYTHLVDDSTS